MNCWFVVHDLKAYEQHSDLIGCRVKSPGLKQAWFKQFAEIKRGDKIVYYATKNNVVVGIFDVVSDMTYREKDPYWNEIMVYSIEPAEMPPTGFLSRLQKTNPFKNREIRPFPEKREMARLHACRVFRDTSSCKGSLATEYIATILCVFCLHVFHAHARGSLTTKYITTL